MDKIPVYLIHGSLGSGKTTVLNRLIGSGVFNNAVVVENEYADYNFDKDMIVGKTKVFGVSGGCICCSSGQELFDALHEIGGAKGNGPLFIETTGVASSVRLVRQLMLSGEFEDKYELVRNILVLDILEDDLRVIMKEKALDVVMADLVILNKADLASADVVEEFKHFIGTVSDALVFVTEYGAVDADMVRSVSKSRADRVLLDNMGCFSGDGADHSKDILYQVIYPTVKIAAEELISEIKSSCARSGMEITRIKGVCTDPAGKRFSIQATKSNHAILPVTGGHDDVLVMIGKNVTKENIRPLMLRLCKN